MSTAQRAILILLFTVYIRSFNIYSFFLSIGGKLLEERLSSTSKFIITFLYAASIVFGLAGNSIAIYFSVTKKAGNRITNMLILNMAIADLLVTIFTISLGIRDPGIARRNLGGC